MVQKDCSLVADVVSDGVECDGGDSNDRVEEAGVASGWEA